MNVPIRMEEPVHFGRQGKGGRKAVEPGAARVIPASRVPRVARLMALAIRWDGLLRKGELKDYADIARLGGVTRARVTQIMNLLLLAPDIQEQLLFQLARCGGRDAPTLKNLQPIALAWDWRKQRKMWATAARDGARPARGR